MNYNYIAPFYDTLSRICFMNRQQIAHRLILPYCKNNQKILWLGGGSGWFLQEMDDLQLNLEIDYVEMSSVMMNKAKSLALNHLKVHFYQEDLFQFETEKQYDVVITAFIFDHFQEEQCEVLLNKYNKRLKKGGLWFYVDFTQEQNKLQRFLTSSMVLFFRLIAGIKTNDFPKIEHLFQPFLLLKEKSYFGHYIKAQIFKK